MYSVHQLVYTITFSNYFLSGHFVQTPTKISLFKDFTTHDKLTTHSNRPSESRTVLTLIGRKDLGGQNLNDGIKPHQTI